MRLIGGFFAVAGLLLALATLDGGGGEQASASAPALQGDANCDGVVDEADALVVLLNQIGLADDPECATAGGDTDCDGDTEADDAIDILAHIAGLGGGVAAAGGDCTPIEGELPSSTPTGTASITPTSTLTPTPTPTASASPTPSLTPTPTASPEPPEEMAYTMSEIDVDGEFPDQMSVIAPVPGTANEVIVGGQGGLFVRVNLDTGEVEDFGDISDLVTRKDENTDEGVLGLTFAPGDPNTIYINYTTGQHEQYNTEGENPMRSRISRFTVSGGLLDNASEEIILEIPQPWHYHNASQLAFDPENNDYLFIGSGDGGWIGSNFVKTQQTENHYAKILRIDVSQPAPSGTPYAIPPENPVIGDAGFDEVWAYGFRNPWRFSFDTETGTMWIGDVGSDNWEEIDIGQPGLNYGWNIMEGPDCFPHTPRPTPSPTPPLCDESPYEPPRTYYKHSDNGEFNGVAVIAGYVYHGTRLPELDGYLIYGDFISARFWGLHATDPDADPILLGQEDDDTGYSGNADDGLTAYTQLPDGEVIALTMNGLWEIVRN